MIAAPILDENGKAIGVVQAINKLMPSGFRAWQCFNKVDENIILELVKVFETMLTEATKTSSAQYHSQLMKSFHGIETSIMMKIPKTIANTLLVNIVELLRCHRVVLYAIDMADNMLVVHASVNLDMKNQIPLGQGIIGYAFKEQVVVKCDECYEDSRFDQRVDQATGYRTSTTVALPIVDRSSGESLGVLQVINKVPPEIALDGYEAHLKATPFSDTDVKIAMTIANELARHIEGDPMDVETVLSILDAAGRRRMRAPAREWTNLDPPRDEAEDALCRICFDRRVDTVSRPCGHSLACSTCSQQFGGVCPLCGEAVTGI